jgi:hypothetical protein
MFSLKKLPLLQGAAASLGTGVPHPVFASVSGPFERTPDAKGHQQTLDLVILWF